MTTASAPRWQYPFSMSALVDVTGYERAAVLDERDHELENYLDQIRTLAETGSGGGGGGGAFTYQQATAATVWNITHGLGFNPNVTVIDSTGATVEGDLSYLTVNSLRLTFSAAFSGTAYLS